MDVIILNVFLTFVCCIDVGLGILDEITPSDTADIRGLSVPVGTASFANGLFGGFEIEHILGDDGKGVSLELPPSRLLQSISLLFLMF